jgi:hypothetical protein
MVKTKTEPINKLFNWLNKKLVSERMFLRQTGGGNHPRRRYSIILQGSGKQLLDVEFVNNGSGIKCDVKKGPNWRAIPMSNRLEQAAEQWPDWLAEMNKKGWQITDSGVGHEENETH